MAVAAVYEQTFEQQVAKDTWNFGLPDVLVVPEMLTDEHTRLRAARFIGAAVLGGGEIEELAEIQSPIESLHDAIHRAEMGDVQARALVETNVRTDVIERTIKTGHVMNPVPLIITKEGKIIQHGQSMDSVQANSLRYAADHPIMRERVEAETRNAFRIEEQYKAGFFDDYSFVVLSLAEDLPEAGFFTDTMSASIQVTRKSGNGLVTEPAFISGVARKGAARHDFSMAIEFGKRMGFDLKNKTAAGIIDTPVLIRNDLIPNGAIDVVRILDDCAGGTFFGEDRTREDYLEYLAKCREREQTFAPKVAEITHELIQESSLINSPIKAVERLHELSEKHMVERAILDTTINPLVFGKVSAQHIEQARMALAFGDNGGYLHHVQKAKDTANSSSCPSGKIISPDDMSEFGNDDFGQDSSKDDTCEFMSKECPVCHKKNVKTKSTKTHISGDCGCKVKK